MNVAPLKTSELKIFKSFIHVCLSTHHSFFVPTTVLGTVLGPWRQRAGDRGSCPQEVHSVSKIFLKNFLRGHVKEKFFAGNSTYCVLLKAYYPLSTVIYASTQKLSNLLVQEFL